MLADGIDDQSTKAAEHAAVGKADGGDFAWDASHLCGFEILQRRCLHASPPRKSACKPFAEAAAEQMCACCEFLRPVKTPKYSTVGGCNDEPTPTQCSRVSTGAASPRRLNRPSTPMSRCGRAYQITQSPNYLSAVIEST